jgi:hypothetical protein
MSDESNHNKEILNIKIRRLQVLEVQNARLGYGTPPSIIMEIEDIRKDIDELHRLLGSNVSNQPLVTLDNAIRKINSRVETVAGDMTLLNTKEIIRIIDQTIAYGSILYESRFEKECAILYFHTAKNLSSLLTKTKDFPVSVPAQLVADIQSELDPINNLSESNFDKNVGLMAWELRFIFNKIMQFSVIERGIEMFSKVHQEIQPLEKPITYGGISELFEYGDNLASSLVDSKLYEGAIKLYSHIASRLLTLINRMSEQTTILRYVTGLQENLTMLLERIIEISQHFDENNAMEAIKYIRRNFQDFNRYLSMIRFSVDDFTE